MRAGCGYAGNFIVAECSAGRKDHDGQELRFFDVLEDSKIMVESLQPVSAGALKRLGDTISPDSVRDLAVGSHARPEHSRHMRHA